MNERYHGKRFLSFLVACVMLAGGFFGGDPELALRYIREAAESGSVSAAFRLGVYLTRQNNSANVEEGLRWIWKAAEKGEEMAYFHLEGIFEFGEHGVRKDKNLTKYLRYRSNLKPSLY